MQLTLKLKIDADPAAVTALRETVRQYTASFNRVAAVGWTKGEKNGVELHKLTYRDEREKTDLPAQLVCSARVKATEAIRSAFALRKKKEKVTCPQSVRCAIRYDARSATVRLKDGHATIASIAGRQTVGLKVPDYHRPKIAGKVCSSDLCENREGILFLHVVVEVTTRPFVPNGEVVGIDFGICKPAVTSTNLFLGEGHWRTLTDQHFRLRRALQSKGTQSARRHLKRLGRKGNRFRSDCDHVLAKRMVESVKPGTVMVVENLTNIRKQTKQKKAQRRRFHTWSFHRLKTFLTYKAELAGVVVAEIDPRNTSRTCSECGHCDKSNRKTQSLFVCGECGFSINADLNAARNIRDVHMATAGTTCGAGLQSRSPSPS